MLIFNLLDKELEINVLHVILQVPNSLNLIYDHRFPIVCRLIITAALVCAVAGYKTFQNQIPNGGNIPHPCKPNFIWQGVGHQSVQGGGDRNPFGTAFKAAGSVCIYLLVIYITSGALLCTQGGTLIFVWVRFLATCTCWFVKHGNYSG